MYTYVCMYVCVYVCRYVYMCMYVHMYVCLYVEVNLQMCIDMHKNENAKYTCNSQIKHIRNKGTVQAVFRTSERHR